MENHFLDSGIIIAFSIPFDQDKSCGIYWEKRSDFNFYTADFLVEKEVRPIVDNSRRDLLRLARAVHKEFDIADINELNPDLKAFARKEFGGVKTPVIDFIEEYENDFRRLILKADDLKDLRKKINKQMTPPLDFVQQLLGDNHPDIMLINAEEEFTNYQDKIDQVQNIIQHDKQMDNKIYASCIITCDQENLNSCYFATIDQDEFSETNENKLRAIDDRIEILIPNKRFPVN